MLERQRPIEALQQAYSAPLSPQQSAFVLRCSLVLRGAGAGNSRGSLGSLVKAHLGGLPSGCLSWAPSRPLCFTFRFIQVPSCSCLLSHPAGFLGPFLGWWQCVGGWVGLCPVVPTEMFSAWNRRDRPPEEGAAAELQGFAVDKTFFSSLKGILLETELVTAASPIWCFCLPHPQLPGPPALS
ncbi:hypothetical protein GHT09_012733 [Marmota monax]|uniref:Uncharacterized protein n=1 Tax=Marmota monax TaxID=9995 RepID=A0A834PMA2_MARMO|nr:hypothetical protein GHT09_012733 [Marmota monax]